MAELNLLEDFRLWFVKKNSFKKLRIAARKDSPIQEHPEKFPEDPTQQKSGPQRWAIRKSFYHHLCVNTKEKNGFWKWKKIMNPESSHSQKKVKFWASTRLSSFDNFAISNFTNQIWGTSITRSRTTKETKINPMKTIHKKTFLPSLFGLMLPLFLSESSRKSVFSLSDERTLLSMLKNSYQLDFQLESDNS